MYFFLWILFWYCLTFSEGYDVDEPFLHGTAIRSVATDKREEFYRWELDVTSDSKNTGDMWRIVSRNSLDFGAIFS